MTENIDEPRWWNLGPFIVETTGNPFLAHYKVYRVADGKRGEMLFEGNGAELGAWSEAVCAKASESGILRT